MQPTSGGCGRQEYPMKKSFLNMSMVLNSAVKKLHRQRSSARRVAGFRPRVEALEDRQLLSTTMEAVASPYPRHPGPTLLYLNFAGDNNNSPFTPVDQQPFTTLGKLDQDIQEILFRTAERYAPFDVEVIGSYAHAQEDQNNGATTVFIGPDPNKVAQSYTPLGDVDTPHWGDPWESPNPPNSDSHDIAYVMPNASWTNWLVSDNVVHESGHTFGLVHIRTQGQDPMPLGPGNNNFPDVMSYDTNHTRFVNQDFTITDYNYNPNSGTSTETGDYPYYWPNQITAQNSFQYLSDVLGVRPPDAIADVAHAAYLDSSYKESAVGQLSFPNAQFQAIDPSISAHGALVRLGDYNVYTVTATTSDPITISVTPGPGSALNPMLLVYHAADDKVVGFNSSKQPAEDGKVTLFNPKIGDTYTIVVGAEDGLSTGSFTVTASEGWQYVPNPSIRIHDVNLNWDSAFPLAYHPITVYFDVSLSHPLNMPVSVFCALEDSFPWLHLSSDSLTIPAFQLGAQIAVQIDLPKVPQGDQLFDIKISNPVNGIIVEDEGLFWLHDLSQHGPQFKFDPPGTNGHPAPHSGGNV
jgi:hypothetical protein